MRSVLDPFRREPVRFASGDSECSGWLYPGSNGACVVMAAGLAVTKEPGTDPLAKRFADAGFNVLAFDYRRLGESGGRPRQVIRMSEQLADWQAAIAFARALPAVDPKRVAIWGFSTSGGHVLRVAARTPDLAAAVAHAPAADGLDAARHAIPEMTLLAMLRLSVRALRDVVGGALGRAPLLIPLTGPRGAVASITTLDARHGPHALDPRGEYPSWRQEIAARSVVRVAFYRPGRHARRIAVPLQVLAYDDDGVAPPGLAVKAARQAPRGELVRLSGGHYEAFMDGHHLAVDAILSFLGRHLGSVHEPPTAQATGPGSPSRTVSGRSRRGGGDRLRAVDAG